MKQIKILPILLCASLILTFAGCAQEPAVTTGSTQPTTQAATQETTLETTAETTEPGYADPSVAYHAPMSAISLPATISSSRASDGATLFTYTCQSMTLSMQDAAVADKILVDFLNRLDSANAEAIRLQAAAASAYASQEDWMPHSLQITYQPVRFDEMVLSLYGQESIYDGNTHGNHANLTVTYDLLTGNALGIRDILVADYSAEDLVKLIVQGLTEYEKQELLFPDYAELISDMFFTNRPVENWYFDQTGLCFFFNPYEIAPYSSGILISQVPYDALGGLLKDSYFPAEAVTFSGMPIVKEYSAADTDAINRYAELIIEEGGRNTLLYADGTLLNVRIETGNGSDDAPGSIIFAATAISKGDAVMISCDDPSSLLLTYETQGQIVRMPLK